MPKRYIIYSVILILSAIKALAVNTDVSDYSRFDNVLLDSEGAVVCCFTQDAQGLVWLGTSGGLYSYNGYMAKAHSKVGDEAHSRIYAMNIYNDNIIIGSDNGVFIYNTRSDRYVSPGVMFPHNVRALLIHNGKLLIGTLNGLYIYDFANKSIARASDIEKMMSNNTVYSLYLDSKDNIWIGTYDGLFHYNIKTKKVNSISIEKKNGKSNVLVNSLIEDVKRGKMWVGTEGDLYEYDIASRILKHSPIAKDNSIKTLALDAENHLLVGTDNGLYVYADNSTVIHSVHDARINASLSNNIIWGIFLDKENNAWLGTEYGVSLLKYNPGIREYPIFQFTGLGDGNRFYRIYKDSRDKLWFGGTAGLIRTESNLTDAIWYKMGDAKYPIRHNRIRDIYETKDHDLWIATDGSINRYNYTTNQFETYNIEDSTRHRNAKWAYNIFEDKNHKLWISTCLGGIFVVDKQRLTSSREQTYIADYSFSSHNGLIGNFVNQMIQDGKGNIWVLLYNDGYFKIDTTTKKVTRFDIENQLGALPNYLICDSDNVIWVAIKGGIARLRANGDVDKLIKFDYYNASGVLAMGEVKDEIWISTSMGLLSLNKKTLEIKHLNVANKQYTSIYYDAPAGNVYLGGVDCVSIVSSSISKVKENRSPIIITDIMVNNINIDSIIDGKSVRYTNEINLRHNQNHLIISVSDFDYSTENRGRFVYRLDGVDRDWNVISSENNQIVYPNLEYGTYKLHICKVDAQGNPNVAEKILTINIAAPWYLTIWAKTVYIILLLSAILFAIRFARMRNRLKIEHIEREKTQEQTKIKIDFFTNISHEFKTPLSIIITTIDSLIHSTKDSIKKQSLISVNNNAMKLNTLIQRSLEFDAIDMNADSMVITSRIEMIEFVRSIFNSFSENIQNRELLFESDVDKIYCELDALKLESVINNLLSNACKYTPSGGVVKVMIKGDNESVTIKVSDTGIGIPESEVAYVFQRFYQSSLTKDKKEGTGIGLYLARTYTEMMGGSISAESKEGKGTSMIVKLPVVANVPQSTEEYADVANNATILIVEDNEAIANSLSQLLRGKYHCIVTHNGRAALDKCAEYVPDLVLSDIMMPIMNGIDMCKQLRQRVATSTVPIILLTAKDDKSTRLLCSEIDVNEFISKPFDPGYLLSRVRFLLQSREAIRKQISLSEITAVDKDITVESQDEKFLKDVTAYIEENMSNSDMSVANISDSMSVNSKQLYRKIKQLTSVTPVEYIKNIRLKKAAMLLKQGKFTVSEVMYMVGFSNSSYFSKCFSEEFGCTPKQYVNLDK